MISALLCVHLYIYVYVFYVNREPNPRTKNPTRDHEVSSGLGPRTFGRLGLWAVNPHSKPTKGAHLELDYIYTTLVSFYHLLNIRTHTHPPTSLSKPKNTNTSSFLDLWTWIGSHTHTRLEALHTPSKPINRLVFLKIMVECLVLVCSCYVCMMRLCDNMVVNLVMHDVLKRNRFMNVLVMCGTMHKCLM